MKSKLSNGLTSSMVAVILLSMIAILPASAQVTPEMYMIPASNPPLPGPYVSFYWNITFYVKDVSDLYSFQVGLTWNKTAGINATRAWRPTWDPLYVFYGRSSVIEPSFGSYNTTFDYYWVGDVTTGATFSGTGKLAVIEFHILSAPAKYTALTTVLGINDPKERGDTILEDSVGDIAFTATDGKYKWEWKAPTALPWLEVDPSSKVFPQESKWVGAAFDVKVVIKNLDVGWALTNATFRLKFNYTVIDVKGAPAANITVPNPPWNGLVTKSISYNVPSPGIASIDVFAATTLKPSTPPDVVVATIKFTVMTQKNAPTPDPIGSFDDTALDLQDVVLNDHLGPITQSKAPVDGYVKVVAFLALTTPYLTVEPANLILNPNGELVIGSQFGKEFTLNVKINNLEERWKLIGIQFRLSYDPTKVQVVSAAEGPYLYGPGGPWPNGTGPWARFGTFHVIYYPEDMLYGNHLLFGDLILPNGTGYWKPPFPGFPPAAEGSGVIASITFKPLVQSWLNNITTKFEFLEIIAVSEVNGDIPINWALSKNGSLTIVKIAPRGRHIDVWMFDPALGGQGLGQPADLVLPQMGLNITAKVTYNWQPVSYKKVTFEIRGPFPHGNFERGKLWAVLQDDTCDDGHAYAFFRMPWTGHSAEELIGAWGVKVSVTLADVVITDYMEFDYDYLIRIWSVTTNKAEYMKSNDVIITVRYGTKSKRMQTVTMYATIQDELGVPIGIASLTKKVGGGQLCTYKNFTDTRTIHIPFWAYAGRATVRVSFVSGLPSQGGEAVAQERTAIIWILPVHWDDPWFVDP